MGREILRLRPRRPEPGGSIMHDLNRLEQEFSENGEAESCLVCSSGGGTYVEWHCRRRDEVLEQDRCKCRDLSVWKRIRTTATTEELLNLIPDISTHSYLLRKSCVRTMRRHEKPIPSSSRYTRTE
jgi:hypothetical protein